MPHTNRKSRRSRKALTDPAKSDVDVSLRDTLGYIVAVPDFKPQRIQRYTFRWTNDIASVAYTTAWTTQMMLDIYCLAIGGASVQPCRLFNAMRLRSVKMWTGAVIEGDQFGLEFSPALVAGYAGAPRIPVLGTRVAPLAGSKINYIYGIPKKNELASQWFTAQQGAYTLFNLSFPGAGGTGGSHCLELDFDCVLVNGETPSVTSFVTSAAKGTIGTGNFSGYSLSGWRSVGLVNLATP